MWKRTTVPVKKRHFSLWWCLDQASWVFIFILPCFMTRQENLRMEWFTKWRSSRYVLRSSRIINPMMNRGRPKKRRSFKPPKKLSFTGSKCSLSTFKLSAFWTSAIWKMRQGTKLRITTDLTCVLFSIGCFTVFENHIKRSHSTLRAKRATFTKSSLKTPKIVNYGEFWQLEI